MSNTPTQVNEHYLDRVVAIADTSGVEATEDIMAGNGMKLVAKGARIDGRMKERLMAYQLIKPLESMLRVVDSVAASDLDSLAEHLLETQPLLAALCGRIAGKAVVSQLRHIKLSQPVEALLSVYRKESPTRLSHAVGVALMAGAMGQELPAAQGVGLQTMILAGLLHDVGELYIDPAILKPTGRLTADQMKHIATHPLVAGHLLRDMAGAGPAVADIVLHHHERRDGFGYPFGYTAERLPAGGQVLAAAELMMGLIESGRAPSERAAVAVKLIPGEFDRPVLDRIVRASRSAPSAEEVRQAAAPSVPAPELAARVVGLHATLTGLNQMSGQAVEHASKGSPALKALAQHAADRCVRIYRAFSSTGLDVHGPAELLAVVEGMEPHLRFEVDVVVRELEWRLREVKREVRRRAERLSAADQALVARIIDGAKAQAREAIRSGEAIQRGEIAAA